MKKILGGLLVAAFATVAFSPAELKIGDTLPKAEVKLKDVSGKDVTLKETSKSNGLLVMFSCNTCPYVIKNQQRTNDILSYAQSQKIGVAVLNSNEAQRLDADSYDEMKSYSKKQGYKWLYAVDKDSELADAFGAAKTPECYLFNSKGILVYHGAIDDSPTDESSVKTVFLKEAIKETVAGKEVTVKTSKSIGCSIKRAKG